MEDQLVGFVPAASKDFPTSLKKIPFPPERLYYRGNYSGFNFSRDIFVAVVGTRHPSRYGSLMAQKIAGELARLGVVIVSGLALGIDTEVHRAVLEVGGRTVAVLGCGIEKVYPPANIGLAEEIVKQKGLILSEFPGTALVDKELFRARNRLISGLSRGTLIIEGTGRSGTLLTARYALEQGKEVLALPGPADSLNSQAPHLLLKQGAALVTSAQDVLDCLGLTKRYNRAND